MKLIYYKIKKELKITKKNRSIQYVILAMIFLSSLFFYKTTLAVEVEGSILTDTDWTEEMSPYVITGDILIARDVALRIEQGVIVKFSDANVFHIEVRGTLDAQGSDNNPIVFSTEDKDHYWGYIEFTKDSTAWDDSSSSGCILSHCVIEYAGDAEKDIDGMAAIRSVSASPLIRNSIIRYSKTDGIHMDLGIPNIYGNRIHDTVCGIKMISPEGGLVENNYLINNEQGIYLESGTNIVEIRNNTVKSLSSEIYGGCLGINLLYYDNLASYFWEQIAEPDAQPFNPDDVMVTSDPNDVMERTFTFTVPDVSEDKSLTFQLTVTDKAGLVSVDTVDVNVKGENKRPLAVAGADQTVVEGDQVTLDGSNSSDPDGVILFYDWEQTSGPEDTLSNPNSVQVTLSNPNSVHCTFKAPTVVSTYGEEIYVFQLTVTDTGGLQSKDTVNIHVIKEDHNEAPVAYAGTGKRVSEGDLVTLDGSGSTDPEGAIISWLWKQTEGPRVDISYSASQKPEFTAPEVGWEGESLIFELTVTDDAFQEGTDKVFVNVVDSDPNDRHLPLDPNAGLDQEVDEGDYVTLNGSATDPNGALDTDSGTSYEWEQISGPFVTFSATEKSPSFTSPDVTESEELIFRLIVTDVHGLKSDDRVTVKVEWINDWPIAEAILDPNDEAILDQAILDPNITIEEGYKVHLDGSDSSDTDDGIASYLWEQISGPEVILSNNIIAKPEFMVPELPSNEQLIFRLTVTDRGGESTQDTVIVNIPPTRRRPVADAGKDQTVAGGTDVRLDGSGSYDPDYHEDPNYPKDPNKGIVSYLWKEVSNQWEWKETSNQWEREDKTTVTLYDATTAHPYFVAPQPEEGEDYPFSSQVFQSLVFLLTVKDKDGKTSSDSVVVNITVDQDIDPNRMPVAEAGPDQTVAAGSTVILDGSSSRDPDVISEVHISNNRFTIDDSEDIGNAIAIKKDPYANSLLSITENNMENLNGNFMIYLYNWADRDSGPVDMTGNWWGTASAGRIGSMIYDQDQDEHLPQVAFDPAKGAEIPGAGSDLSYPPMADAGEDQEEAYPDDIVTLNGSGTYDPDNIMSYSWTQTEGQTVTIHDARSASATFIAPFPGEEVKVKTDLRFKLTVTDAKGFYDTDEVIVTIMASVEDVKRETSSGCFISSMIPVRL